MRRRAIVVLSDGEDTSSLVSYEEVLDLAKRSETAIYTIGLQPKDAPQTKGFREAEFVLRQFAQETGGRSFFPSRVEDLKDVYGQIADELSSQYTLGLRVEERPARRRLAPGRGADRAAASHRAHQTRVLRAGGTVKVRKVPGFQGSKVPGFKGSSQGQC